MINFIIYEDNKKWQEYYKNCILKIIGQNNLKYNILIFEKYEKSLDEKLNNLIGKKIYLLDLKVPGKSGLDLARNIRTSGDWFSPIIIVTFHNHFKNEGYTSKILMLDFIVKNENINEQITSSLKLALKINESQLSFNFTINHELYQIPYNDIFYFEKNKNDNYTNIITKTKSYKIKKSIKELSHKFENISFLFKTHQSCIVNLNNILKVDFTNHTIYFSPPIKTQLLSRENKKYLKEQIIKRDSNDYLQNNL